MVQLVEDRANFTLQKSRFSLLCCGRHSRRSPRLGASVDQERLESVHWHLLGLHGPPMRYDQDIEIPFGLSAWSSCNLRGSWSK